MKKTCDLNSQNNNNGIKTNQLKKKNAAKKRNYNR